LLVVVMGLLTLVRVGSEDWAEEEEVF